MIGNLSQGFEMTARVYDPKGISPTLRVAGDGGNKEVKIIVNETICLNSKVNGKQPSLKDRVYDGGGYHSPSRPRRSSWEK